MAQAKTLTVAEFQQVLSYFNTRNFALRNRTMFLISQVSARFVVDNHGVTVTHSYSAW